MRELPYHRQRHVDRKRGAASFWVASRVIGGEAHRSAGHRSRRRGGGLYQMRSWRPVGSRGQSGRNDVRASNVDIEMEIPGICHIGARAKRRRPVDAYIRRLLHLLQRDRIHLENGMALQRGNLGGVEVTRADERRGFGAHRLAKPEASRQSSKSQPSATA